MLFQGGFYKDVQCLEEMKFVISGCCVKKSCYYIFHLFLLFPLLHPNTIWTVPFQRHMQDTQQHLSDKQKKKTGLFIALDSFGKYPI